MSQSESRIQVHSYYCAWYRPRD